MGLNIAGVSITSTAGSGLQISPGMVFANTGYAYVDSVPGYSGWKDISGNDIYYSAVAGWEINTTAWSGGGLNTTTGVFTCPRSGYYAVGFNGIANAGQFIDAGTSYGYAGFAKNGALSYYIHWNISSTNSWQQVGGSSLFECAANDTLAFFVNRSPSPVVGGQTYNRGWWPHNHHAIWCALVG